MTDGAAAGAAGTGGAGGTGAAGGAGGAADWAASLPADQKGYVENKGWKSPADLLTSYRNLEGLAGDPNKLFRLPADDKPESWNPIFDKLGRPKAPEEYKLPIPEGDNGEFAKIASGEFHKLGLTTKQAQGLATWWNGFAQESVAKQTQERMSKVEAGRTALQAEWKTDYDKNMAVAQQAAQKLGFTKDIVDALEDKMGYDGVMKFVHTLGAKLGEHGFHTARGAGGGFGGNAAAAKAEIQALRSDGDFQTRLGNKEAAALAKWEQLHKAAYPEQAA